MSEILSPDVMRVDISFRFHFMSGQERVRNSNGDAHWGHKTENSEYYFPAPQFRINLKTHCYGTATLDGKGTQQCKLKFWDGQEIPKRNKENPTARRLAPNNSLVQFHNTKHQSRHRHSL